MEPDFGTPGRLPGLADHCRFNSNPIRYDAHIGDWRIENNTKKGRSVYLAQLSITNFRKLKKAELNFQKGLNLLVGSNNAGKTAVVDALRALLTGHDEPYPRLDD